MAGTLLCTTCFAQIPAPASPPADRPMPLAVVINGAASGTWVLVQRGGVLYAPADAFEEWRLELGANAPTIQFRGQKYFALTAVPGFDSKLDVATQTVELKFSPKAFATSRMTPDLEPHLKVSPVLPSAFLNYDISYQHSVVKGDRGARDLGVLSEAGLSTGWGVLTNSSTIRNIAGYDLEHQPRHWLRLETTLTRDFPESNYTLRLGDTTTKPAMWGRDVYFGGVRFGTNFALNPSFVSQPLPVLTGLSSAPSTVELYVNDVLRSVSNVPTGPFVIDRFPLLTGNGEARLVVRDLLGRDTVITQPFFITTELLRAGLNDWSVEAGRVRRNLGTESADYGDAFASGTWRRGVNDRFTVETRAEASHRVKLLGAGMLSMLPWNLLARAALVGTRTENLGDGGHWLLGLERQGVYGGASIEYRHASTAFREVGELDSVSPTRAQLAATASYSTSWGGNLGLAYARIDRLDGSRITTLSGNYSRRIGASSTLAVTASRALSGGSGSAVGVSFIMPLDVYTSASFTANARSDTQDAYASAVRNPGLGSNAGWRVLAGEEHSRARAEGGLYYQTQYGNVSGDASVASDAQTLRVGAVGALVFAAGHGFATQRVDESFAIAQVPGYPGVGVGLGSNVMAHTDASGTALIPRLIPYTTNSIRLDPKELPINAEIESIERYAVPAWRSAVKVTFPVRGGRGALLRIVLDGGTPAPAGAVVSIEGDKETFYVARRGEAYVTGLEPSSRVFLSWNDERCALQFTLPPPKGDEIPRVGPVACHGVKP